ncbi:hypothetical protein DERP_015418 [Dermatophagoides pteronyssinus]|uniref:Uncharacterized protein n=1 Tax=Dermatophagoides pteronyssinus TaxID=6956 RepID=A0ABQ8J1H6_DERPT|nr:hypothetical protein DERP_015418 [Dermatophagoides pteronyssinus]
MINGNIEINVEQSDLKVRKGSQKLEFIMRMIKHYKHGKNFKNIAFSLAQLHQESIFIRKFWFPDPEPPQDCIDLPKKWHPFPLGYGIMKGHYRRRFQIRIGNWIFNKTWGIVQFEAEIIPYKSKHEPIFLKNLFRTEYKQNYQQFLLDVNWWRYEENMNMQTIK